MILLEKIFFDLARQSSEAGRGYRIAMPTALLTAAERTLSAALIASCAAMRPIVLTVVSAAREALACISRRIFAKIKKCQISSVEEIDGVSLL